MNAMGIVQILSGWACTKGQKKECDLDRVDLSMNADYSSFWRCTGLPQNS